MDNIVLCTTSKRIYLNYGPTIGSHISFSEFVLWPIRFFFFAYLPSKILFDRCQ